MRRGFKVKINNANAPCSVLTVSVFPNNSERLGIKEYHIKNYGWGYMDEELVTFNGIEAVRVHTDCISAMCRSDSISFIEGTFLYNIGITWSNLADKEILEDILHSFNFENLEVANKARDSRITTAISQIRTIMNQVYIADNNYNNFDLDNEDISRFDFVNQVIKDGGSLVLSCKPSNSNWTNVENACVYSNLIGVYRWYCADSSGNAGFCEGVENDPAPICGLRSLKAQCPSGCK